MENIMINRLVTLIIIARKLALSDALKIFSKYYNIPILVRVFVGLFSISFTSKKSNSKNKNRKM